MGKSDIKPNQLNMFDTKEEQTRRAANTKLVEYGIQNEVSDWRVHVGWGTQHVIAFPTSSGKKVIEAKLRESGRAEAKAVSTRGITTALGFAVPISYLDGMSEILIPPDLHRKYQLSKTADSTSRKGAVAVAVVMAMLGRRLIPLPCVYDETDDKALQVQGQDILVNSSLRVQVKMDWDAGSRVHGGTGNVYLQVAECNPFRSY